MLSLDFLWQSVQMFNRDMSHVQWCIQRFSDTVMLVWLPKIGGQIKGELMQNNISHLILSSVISSTRSQTFNLSKILNNVELKTLCMPGSVVQVCLNVSQCIVCINRCAQTKPWIWRCMLYSISWPNFIVWLSLIIDIGRYVYFSYLLSSLWHHKFWA